MFGLCLALSLAAGCASSAAPPATAPPAPPPPALRASPLGPAAAPIPSAAPSPAPEPTATPSAEAAPELNLPLAELGEPGPASLERVGHAGSWLVLCRQGKAPHPELAAGTRAAEPIDDLLGWDVTGRFVVVRSAGVPWLLDVSTHARTSLAELGFDDRDDTLDYRQHRALAFDPRGEILAYLRRKPSPALVLRTLASGDERLVAGVPGEPWRLAWDATGTTLVVSSVTEDTTKNGTLDFPVRLRKGPRQRCSAVLPHFHLSPENGDRPSSFLVARDGASLRPAPDFVLPFGSDYVSRGPDGSLALERAGKKLPLADADCGGRVLFADPARSVLVVTCTNDKLKPKRLGVELVGPGYRQELGVIVQSMALDRWPEAPTRLLPLYPGADALLLDLDTRKTLPLHAGDRVLTTSGPRALVRRDKTLVWVDADHGTETVAVAKLERLDGLLVEGALVAVGGLVLDAASGRVLGALSGYPLALTPTGAGLVPEGGRASSDAFPSAPFRWHPYAPSH